MKNDPIPGLGSGLIPEPHRRLLEAVVDAGLLGLHEIDPPLDGADGSMQVVAAMVATDGGAERDGVEGNPRGLANPEHLVSKAGKIGFVEVLEDIEAGDEVEGVVVEGEVAIAVDESDAVLGIRDRKAGASTLDRVDADIATVGDQAEERGLEHPHDEADTATHIERSPGDGTEPITVLEDGGESG